MKKIKAGMNWPRVRNGIWHEGVRILNYLIERRKIPQVMRKLGI